jgi:predicted transcriptional regulator
MDRYDSLILEIIHDHKTQSTDKEKIKLRHLERTFWKQIESDKDLNVGQGRIGERITKLYVNGLIENKEGYMLTRKGKVQLEVHAGLL